MKAKNDGSTEAVYAPPKTVAEMAKERGTPDWLTAALKHHFRKQQTVTAAEFDAEASRIANHPIGAGR